MKRILISVALFALLAINTTGQISFNRVIMQVPNSTTTMNAVEIGDVTNDGLNDIVAGSVSYNLFYELYIVVYAQKKDGTMAAPITLNYTKTYQPLNDIEIADVNNDKLNDIVIAFGSSIGIYYQLPAGGFSVMKTLTGITASHGIKTGDLNNDGLIDILGFDNSSYKIFYQTPSGEFNLKSIPVKQTNYTQLQIGDLNGDGLNDIANTCTSQIEVLYQKNGMGITKADSLIINPISNGMHSTTISGFTIADVNNDGKQDIVTADGGNSGRMSLFYQIAGGKIDTANAKSYAAYDIPTPIRVADLNCDGDNEIIIGNDAWEKISIYNKHGLGDYSSYTLYPSLYYFKPFSLAVGDINNDKRPDIIDVDQNAKISILYNTSKPLTFDRYEKKALNLQIKKDTTVRDTIIYLAIPDTAKICKRNNFLKQQIHQTINNEHYSGDSLLIRHAMLCSAYTDTIKTAFSFTKKIIINTDTIKSIENRDLMTVSFGQTSFPSGSGYTYAFISSNICWSVTVDKDWIKPNNYSGNNGGNGKPVNSSVSFSISSNPTIYARTATITLSGDGFPSRIFTINQQGATPAIYTSTSSIILSESVSNSAYILIGANVNWKTSIDADWLTLDKMQGTPTGAGYDVITVIATPNITEIDKNATITFVGDENVVKTVTVKQSKKDLSAVKNISEEGIRIYPNPIQNKLIIETDLSHFDQQIQIYDLRGLSVYNANLTSQRCEIDFSNMQKGMYLLKLKIDGNILVRKLIKQ